MEPIKNLGGRPEKYSDVESLSAKIEEYFNYCDKQTKTYITKNGPPKTSYKPYTVIGLCNFLGICRETFSQYQKDRRFSDATRSAKSRCEAWLEEHAINGETQPLVSIFSLKNNYGWKDKTETEITITVNATDNIQAARERAKIKAATIPLLNEHIIDGELIPVINKEE